MYRKHGVYLELVDFCVYWHGTPVAQVKSNKKGWAIFKAYENREIKTRKKK